MSCEAKALRIEYCLRFSFVNSQKVKLRQQKLFLWYCSCVVSVLSLTPLLWTHTQHIQQTIFSITTALIVPFVWFDAPHTQTHTHIHTIPRAHTLHSTTRHFTTKYRIFGQKVTQMLCNTHPNSCLDTTIHWMSKNMKGIKGSAHKIFHLFLVFVIIYRNDIKD